MAMVQRGGCSHRRMLKKGQEMGSILFIVGIVMLVSAFGSGSFALGVVGVILAVVGGVLFWQTSATKAYLDQNKKQ